MMKGGGFKLDQSMVAELQRQLGSGNPLEALAGMATGGKKNPLAALAPDLSECKALQTAMIPEMGPSIIYGPNVQEVDDISRWTIVYPQYLDKKRSRKEGRKMERSLCVDDPDVGEMAEAATEMGLRCVLERDKCYPRDFLVRGRVRVETKDPQTGEVLYNKSALMELMASVMLNLESRTRRLAAAAAAAKAKEAEASKQAAKAAPKASTGKGSAAASKSKKKRK